MEDIAVSNSEEYPGPELDTGYYNSALAALSKRFVLCWLRHIGVWGYSRLVPRFSFRKPFLTLSSSWDITRFCMALGQKLSKGVRSSYDIACLTHWEAGSSQGVMPIGI